MHDQTVRLLNLGLKPREIAEQLRLPPGLENEWFVRGYYGTLSHNSKAIYQRYLGWYDANPVNLNPLPQADSARRSVAYMGGAAAVLERARADYTKGDYRWVAEVTMQVVYAAPDSATPDSAALLRQARELCADALEQLGYQSESGVWRNAYLMGALELRVGLPGAGAAASASPDVIRALPLDLWFDFLAVRLNADRAAGKSLVVNWTFPDTKEIATLTLSNSALSHTLGRHADKPDVAVTLDRSTLDQINLQQRSFGDAVRAGNIRVVGNPQLLLGLLAMLDNFKPGFEIVVPLGMDSGGAAAGAR
jgi:alkyl sulfatase BDS1-like metallo-beta-lactamase superfamily hydrolase